MISNFDFRTFAFSFSFPVFRYQPPDGTFLGHEIFSLVGHLEKAVYDTRGVKNM